MGLKGFLVRSVKETILLYVVILLVCLVLLGGIGILESGTGLDFGPEPISEEDVEDEMIQRINAERSEEGLNNVTEIQTASELADRHTQSMNQTGNLSYDIENSTTNTRLGRIGCDPGAEMIVQSYVFESVRLENQTMYASNAPETAELLITTWMNSEPNKEVVLDPRWVGVGIGITINEEDEVYAAQIFCGV